MQIEFVNILHFFLTARSASGPGPTGYGSNPGFPSRMNHTCEQPVIDAVDITLTPYKDTVYCAARTVMSLNYTLSHLHIPDLPYPDFSFLYGLSGPTGAYPYGPTNYPYYGPTSYPYYGPTSYYGPTNYPYYGPTSDPYGPTSYPYGPQMPNTGQSIDCHPYMPQFSGLNDDQILNIAEQAVNDGLNYITGQFPLDVDSVMACVNSQPGQSPSVPTHDAMRVKQAYDNVTAILNQFANDMMQAIQTGKFLILLIDCTLS